MRYSSVLLAMLLTFPAAANAYAQDFNAAEQSLQTGQYDAARQELAKIDRTNADDYIKAQLGIARIDLALKQYDKAKLAINNAEPLIADDSLWQMPLALIKVDYMIAAENENFDAIIAIYEKAYAVAETQKDTQVGKAWLGRLCYELASTCRKMNDNRHGRHWIDDGITFAKSAGETLMLAKSLMLKGWLENDRGKERRAIMAFDEAIQRLTSYGDKAQLAAGHRAYAEMLTKMGRTDDAAVHENAADALEKEEEN